MMVISLLKTEKSYHKETCLDLLNPVFAKFIWLFSHSPPQCPQNIAITWNKYYSEQSLENAYY